jgi:PST family polysaccharide transporter
MTVTAAPQTDNLKQKVVQSGTSRLFGQAANFILRLASLTIMARLLSPEQFGLVAMVTVVSGLYGLLTSAGLSSATVQRVTVTDAQISTLFWINMLIGAVLSALCLATAPALVAFYDEPRLLWVTAAMAAGFLINAAGVQHIALLQRELRFVTLTLIEVLAQVASLAIGIALAVAGFGYWALVASTLAGPAVLTVLAWTTTRWIPGRPHRDAEVLSMLRFGGLVTIQSVLYYVAQNIDKVLIGRFRGADAVGIYGRAYQLVACR